MEIEGFLDAFEFPKEPIVLPPSIERDTDGADKFSWQSTVSQHESEKQDAVFHLHDDPDMFFHSATTSTQNAILPIDSGNAVLSKVYYIPDCFEESFLEVIEDSSINMR
eukprot:750024-Hanusia_phi.AAC.1